MCCRDINPKMFPYKSYIGSSLKIKKLYEMKYSDKYDYCGLEVESILYLFCGCDSTTQIRQQISVWLSPQGLNLEYFTATQIVFSDKNWNPMINRIMICTKLAIFKNKASKEPLSIATTNASLQIQFMMEQYIARINNRLQHFRGFWAPIRNEAQHTGNSAF